MAFRFINSPLLTDCLDSLSNRRNVAFYLFSTAISMLTNLLSLLTACFSPSSGFATQDFLLLFILILSIYLMQELTSIFTLSSLTFANSGTLLLCLLVHLPMKEECQGTLTVNWTSTPASFLLLSFLQGVASSGIFF